MAGVIMRTALALAAGLGISGLAAQAGAQSCDRACLIRITDRYLAALAAHDPGKAPLAPNVTFVENVTRMKPGEGLWKTASGGPTAFKVYVPDAALQQAGWIGVIQQHGKPMMLALRLKVVNGRITEAEHLVSAPIGGPENPNIVTVRPALARAIPAAQRLPHDRLLAIGKTYYDALDDNKGSEARSRRTARGARTGPLPRARAPARRRSRIRTPRPSPTTARARSIAARSSTSTGSTTGAWWPPTR